MTSETDHAATARPPRSAAAGFLLWLLAGSGGVAGTARDPEALLMQTRPLVVLEPLSAPPAPASPARPSGDAPVPESLRLVLVDLGIHPSYPQVRGYAPCEESSKLESVGRDIAGRDALLRPEAAAAWRRMREAARREGVTLQLVSAFRSVEYQKGIIRRKLEEGQALDEILRANMPPGYSEHHTGRAVDITTPGAEPLAEAFEKTKAFDWLNRRAADFGFSMSYPRDNADGILYEPWHWAWRPAAAESNRAPLAGTKAADLQPAPGHGTFRREGEAHP